MQEEEKLYQACKKYYEGLANNRSSKKIQLKILREYSLQSQYYPLHITCERLRSKINA